MGSREPQRICEQEKALARAACLGRAGSWGAGQTGHGLSSGAADLGDVLGHTPLRYLPSVLTPMWTMHELLRVQAGQGSNSILHVRLLSGASS